MTTGRLAALAITLTAAIGGGTTAAAATPPLPHAAPDVQALTTNIRGWMGRQGYPTRPGAVRVTPQVHTDPACGCPQAGHGAWGYATPAGTVIDRHVHTALRRGGWRTAPESVQLLIHEELHRASGLAWWHRMTTDEQAVEEGVVQAVSHDLAIRYLAWRTGGRWGYPVGRYRREVQAIRVASMRATGGPWTAPAAHRWRRTLLYQDRAGRARMLAAVPHPVTPGQT